jgi:hypothetical protein
VLACLQAGGRRFDPGWLHWRSIWKSVTFWSSGPKNPLSEPLGLTIGPQTRGELAGCRWRIGEGAGTADSATSVPPARAGPPTMHRISVCIRATTPARGGTDRSMCRPGLVRRGLGPATPFVRPSNRATPAPADHSYVALRCHAVSGPAGQSDGHRDAVDAATATVAKRSCDPGNRWPLKRRQRDRQLRQPRDDQSSREWRLHRVGGSRLFRPRRRGDRFDVRLSALGGVVRVV